MPYTQSYKYHLYIWVWYYSNTQTGHPAGYLHSVGTFFIYVYGRVSCTKPLVCPVSFKCSSILFFFRLKINYCTFRDAMTVRLFLCMMWTQARRFIKRVDLWRKGIFKNPAKSFQNGCFNIWIFFLFCTSEKSFSDTNKCTKITRSIKSDDLDLYKNCRHTLPICYSTWIFISVFNWPLSMESEEYALIFPKWLYPINNISLTLSILLVMLIAHERWVSSEAPNGVPHQQHLPHPLHTSSHAHSPREVS